MTLPPRIQELVERFRENREAYRSGSYNETQIRREFIDPFFEELGWDINNSQGYAEAYKDVIHEDAIKIGGNTKAPDYAFRIGGTRKFFLEAKKPAVNIKKDISPAYQLRRYAWSAKLPLSILTDFEEMAVYDCRVKPEKSDRASVARVAYYTFDDYQEKWDEIAAIFSRTAVLKGSFDKYADDNKRKRGTAEVDSAFLAEIESWRETLARNIALRNPALSVRELNTAVQRTIDRIIFLRIAEDRGIEHYGRLQSLKEGKDVYNRLGEYFRKADDRYNSGLFHFRVGDGSSETLDTFTLNLKIDDKVLKPILGSLYYPESPYEFSVLPADILGQVYEQFLGKVIRLSGRQAVVEEKPEVKKAGGVYYTPTYVVRHIVENTIGTLLRGKTPAQVAGLDKRLKDTQPLRIIDPACGSGSFLIEAYQFLLDWHRDQYVAEGPEKSAKGRNPKLYQAAGGEWRLTIAERRRILLTHIFGVDIDPQAVEVTKLSLLLKVLEGENSDAIARQMDMFHIRALPDLASNIKCGNSLIDSQFYKSNSPSMFDDDELLRINVFDWNAEFKFLTDSKGFTAIIGNPPWISLTGKFRNEIYTEGERNYLVERYSGNSYMPNVYEYFISRGLELVRPGGMFSFIVPDRFGYNDQFIRLRKVMLSDFRLEEIVYRAPFPGVTADTLIFGVSAEKVDNGHAVRISEYGKPIQLTTYKAIRKDERCRFEYKGADDASAVIEKIRDTPGARLLKQIVATTSGVGGKSAAITRERIGPKQIEILKGESIQRYEIRYPFYFEFSRNNITGRTTDRAKLGFTPKILIRKTGARIIAAFDDSGIYPEQSLYFTYGEASEDIYYLLGVLNSRLMSYLYYHSALTNKASIAQVKKVDLDALPIVVSGGEAEDDARIKEIGNDAKELLVQTAQIKGEKLEQKRSICRRRIASLEEAINAAVYGLYRMSEEERKKVDEWYAEAEVRD